MTASCLGALKKKCNDQLARIGLTLRLITLCPDKEVWFDMTQKWALT